MSRTLQGQSFIDAMEWFESFGLTFWPSAMLLIARRGAGTQQWMALLIAIVVNVAIYALIGAFVSLALRHRLALISILVVLLAIMCGLNIYWSEHAASFVISAALVIVLFVVLLRSRKNIGPPDPPLAKG